MAGVSIRHAEPDDAEALSRLLAGPNAISGTHCSFTLRAGRYADAFSMARLVP